MSPEEWEKIGRFDDFGEYHLGRPLARPGQVYVLTAPQPAATPAAVPVAQCDLQAAGVVHWHPFPTSRDCRIDWTI